MMAFSMKGGGALPVAVFWDLASAFYSLAREFFFEMLEKIGMDECETQAIKTLHNRCKHYLRVSGRICGTMLMSEGTQQGNPLSAFIFILVPNLFGKKSHDFKCVLTEATQDLGYIRD